MAAGVLTGLANACLATVILQLVLGVTDDENTRAFREALRVSSGDAASLFVQEILIEIADKTIALVTAAAFVVLVFERPRPALRRHG